MACIAMANSVPWKIEPAGLVQSFDAAFQQTWRSNEEELMTLFRPAGVHDGTIHVELKN